MRKDKIIENKPPGRIQGFFGKIAVLIPNEDHKNLVGKMLDEKADNRLDSKTVEQLTEKILKKEPIHKFLIPLVHDGREKIEGNNEAEFKELI